MVMPLKTVEIENLMSDHEEQIKKTKKANADRLSELNEMMMATKNAFEQQVAQNSYGEI